ncbi:MAG: NIPSNAP family protein [Planctomycetes bacterium]|nr:NIPSNAP family protein [Planctomycetota bacterium]
MVKEIATRSKVAAQFLGIPLLVIFLGLGSESNPSGAAAPAPPGKVYGEWRIRVRPDQGAEYGELIKEKGLPLFREAGGRMVGWWTTLIGDLYEHVTIWEYDGMLAFEKAVQFLGQEERFKKFAAARDPLLSGEESRFLKLSSLAEKPALPEAGKFVIHEVHRVPLGRQKGYFKSAGEVAGLLKKNGFRFAGPFLTAVGRWSEITYLFFYEGLAERDEKLRVIAANGDGEKIDRLLAETVEEITTRLLVPAPFVQAAPLAR